MLACGRFCEYIDEFVRLNNERETDETMFEIWLHRVWDKSYSAFLKELEEPDQMGQADFEATINESASILEGFNPESE